MDLELVDRIELDRIVKLSTSWECFLGTLEIVANAVFCLSNGTRAKQIVQLKIEQVIPGGPTGYIAIPEEGKLMLIKNIKNLFEDKDSYFISVHQIIRGPNEQAALRMEISTHFVDTIQKLVRQMERDGETRYLSIVNPFHGV